MAGKELPGSDGSGVLTRAEEILAISIRHDAMNKLALEFTAYLMDHGFFKTCANCSHWIEGPPHNRQQLCGLFKQRPPTNIIVSGCPEHSDNIPF